MYKWQEYYENILFVQLGNSLTYLQNFVNNLQFT